MLFHRPTTVHRFAIAICLILPSAAQAHMPWLATDDEGHAIMWFGESPEDRTYHMPESVAGIRLFNGKTSIATHAIDSDALIGMRSENEVESIGEIAGSVTYGLYHGTKLTYHVEHLPQSEPAQWPTAPRSDASLQSIITSSAGGGVRVTILRDGKPAEGLRVKLYCEDGREEAATETDTAGRVRFHRRVLQPGLNAIVVGVTDEAAGGTLGDKRYDSTTDYLTATFLIPGTSPGSAQDPRPKSQREPQRPTMKIDSSVSVEASNLPDLPEELTSFGAAVAGRTLYVYGGHTGDAHSYSTDEQSDRFWSLDLSAGKNGAWKPLPGGPSLQGLALVAYRDRLIRIGGFTAINELGEEQDLRSRDFVASFDPATKVWTALPALPEPRSSLDAAVLGDRVFVFGGWKLDGTSSESQWHATAWSLDLSTPGATWQPVPTPPFKRRAISVAAHDGQLFVIGGMTSDGKPTTRVDIYDPNRETWSLAPALPGSGMSGFGASAFATGGKLYVSTMDGRLHRLSGDGQRWESIAKSDPARFFHRMLPISDDALLMVGGANMEIGKFTQIDRIQLAR